MEGIGVKSKMSVCDLDCFKGSFIAVKGSTVNRVEFGRVQPSLLADNSKVVYVLEDKADWKSKLEGNPRAYTLCSFDRGGGMVATISKEVFGAHQQSFRSLSESEVGLVRSEISSPASRYSFASYADCKGVDSVIRSKLLL